jgi:hypothetical protein
VREVQVQVQVRMQVFGLVPLVEAGAGGAA